MVIFIIFKNDTSDLNILFELNAVDISFSTNIAWLISFMYLVSA